MDAGAVTGVASNVEFAASHGVTGGVADVAADDD